MGPVRGLGFRGTTILGYYNRFGVCGLGLKKPTIRTSYFYKGMEQGYYHEGTIRAPGPGFVFGGGGFGSSIARRLDILFDSMLTLRTVLWHPCQRPCSVL